MSTEKKFELDLEELEQVNGGTFELRKVHIPDTMQPAGDVTLPKRETTMPTGYGTFGTAGDFVNK